MSNPFKSKRAISLILHDFQISKNDIWMTRGITIIRIPKFLKKTWWMAQNQRLRKKLGGWDIQCFLYIPPPVKLKRFDPRRKRFSLAFKIDGIQEQWVHQRRRQLQTSLQRIIYRR